MWQRKYLAATVIWMALIWYLSAQPDLRTDLPQDFFLRKAAHIFEYGVLTWLLFKAIGSSTVEAITGAALVAFVYAGIDEWHQSFVMGRYGTPRDVAIDAVGILLVSSWLFFLLRRRDCFATD